MIFSGAVVKLSVGARNTLSRSLLALALLALTACSSTPTTHFYVLSGMSHVQSASPQNTKQVSVVIRWSIAQK